MKVITIPKLELQAALLATQLKQDICRAVTVNINKVLMWTDSTTVPLWLNSTTKHPIFIANREHTSVDWNPVTSSDNPADAGSPGMSDEVLQSCSWVADFLRTKQFPFEPSTEVVKNIKLGVVKNIKLVITNKETAHTNTSVAASATKSTK